MLLDPDLLRTALVLSAAVSVAAVLRGFTGFGFGLFAMPIASLLMDPAHAVPLVLSLQLASGVVTLRSDLATVDRGSSAALTAVGLPFVALGSSVLQAAPQDAVRVMIGCVTVGAAVALARAAPVRTPRPSLAVTVAAGASSGFLHGLLAMGGPPLVAYYLRGWFAAGVARASMTLVFSVFSVAPLALAATRGQTSQREMALAAALLPALVLGTFVGGLIFKRMPGSHRAVALIALGVIGAVAAARGAMVLLGGG